MNKKHKKFFKKRKKNNCLRFWCINIGALPIIYKLNLTNKIKFIQMIIPYPKMYYLKKNFYINILNTKNMNILISKIKLSLY